MLYRAPVDTSPVTEGVTLFKHQLLLLLSPDKRKWGDPHFLLPQINRGWGICKQGRFVVCPFCSRKVGRGKKTQEDVSWRHRDSNCTQKVTLECRGVSLRNNFPFYGIIWGEGIFNRWTAKTTPSYQRNSQFSTSVQHANANGSKTCLG